MKIVVGLGNPGKRYENTPHNAGFLVLDELAATLSCSLKNSMRFKSKQGKVVCNDTPLWLVKPQTYMNRSGVAVASIARYNRVDVSDIIVVVDDADIKLGRIRIRRQGGSGGHNGLASVISELGSSDFPRIRVGIGRSEVGQDLVGYVLKPFSKKESEQISAVAKGAASAVCRIIDAGVEVAMNEFNGA